MSLLITFLLCITITLDAVCTNIASNLEMTTINYSVLTVQIIVLIYSIFLTISIIFKNFKKIFKLFYYNIIVRVISNAFYDVLLGKSLTNINIVFYILSYLNVIFSVIMTLIKKDEMISEQENQERRIHPYIHQNTITIIIVSEPLGDHEDNCSICLEPLKHTEVYKTKCSHIFHTECMKKYVNSNKFQYINCPICREELFTV